MSFRQRVPVLRKEINAPRRAGLAGGTAGFKPVNEPVGSDKAWLQLKNDSIRRIGFYFTLAFVFFRFSLLHELLTAKLGFNTYICISSAPRHCFCCS